MVYLRFWSYLVDFKYRLAMQKTIHGAPPDEIIALRWIFMVTGLQNIDNVMLK